MLEKPANRGTSPVRIVRLLLWLQGAGAEGADFADIRIGNVQRADDLHTGRRRGDTGLQLGGIGGAGEIRQVTRDCSAHAIDHVAPTALVGDKEPGAGGGVTPPTWARSAWPGWSVWGMP